MNFENSSHIFRVVTLGDSSVGKTSIINRLVNKEFNTVEQSTIGATFLLHEEEIDDYKIEMQIWDTAGQEKYRSLSPIYCHGAAAALVTFDITKRESFETLETWSNLVTEVSKADTIIFIVANKIDLMDQAEVNEEEMNEWARSRGYKLAKTSAKTGQGIPELFRQVAEEIVNHGYIVLDPPSPTPKKNSDCC